MGKVDMSSEIKVPNNIWATITISDNIPYEFKRWGCGWNDEFMNKFQGQTVRAFLDRRWCKDFDKTWCVIDENGRHWAFEIYWLKSIILDPIDFKIEEED